MAALHLRKFAIARRRSMAANSIQVQTSVHAGRVTPGGRPEGATESRAQGAFGRKPLPGLLKTPWFLMKSWSSLFIRFVAGMR
jgi:hypothetical protein